MRFIPACIPIAVATAILAQGCASAANAQRLPVTPMGVREVQTRFFDGVSSTTAMKAVIDTLQDGGFTIDRTDSALGLIVGTRQNIHRPSSDQKALKYLAVGLTYGLAALFPWGKSLAVEVEASVNVTAIDDGVRVRVALQRRTLDKNGRAEKSEALTEGILYQDLFELLGRSLFVAQGQ